MTRNEIPPKLADVLLEGEQVFWIDQAVMPGSAIERVIAWFENYGVISLPFVGFLAALFYGELIAIGSLLVAQIMVLYLNEDYPDGPHSYAITSMRVLKFDAVAMKLKHIPLHPDIAVWQKRRSVIFTRPLGGFRTFSRALFDRRGPFRWLSGIEGMDCIAMTRLQDPAAAVSAYDRARSAGGVTA